LRNIVIALENQLKSGAIKAAERVKAEKEKSTKSLPIIRGSTP